MNVAGESCTLAIKAIPNAPRSEVICWLGEALKVKVHAPPVEGRANDALCTFLAETLGLPRRAVTVLRSDTSWQKVVRIEGLSLKAAKALFIHEFPARAANQEKRAKHSYRG